MSERHAEASAPCSVDLVVGDLDAGSPVTAVGVAIDRRAWSRVDLGGDGVEVLSKDTVGRIAASSVRELAASGDAPVVAGLLRSLGIEEGVRVQTRSRVPEGSGLGEVSALATAVLGAAQGALGRAIRPGEAARVLGEVLRESGGTGLSVRGVAMALHGGTVAMHLDAEQPRAEPLAVDPARVEESLLLVDSGSTRATGGDSPVTGPSSARMALARVAAELRVALLEGRFGDVTGLVAEEWEARKRLCPGVTTPEIDRVVDLARGVGGAARACGSGPGGLVAVWAPPGARGPGRREAVEEALGGAGLRVFPARVDLLGLDTG